MLALRQRNEARRLVALIDALYEARVQLYLQADAPLEELFAPLLDGHAPLEMLGGAGEPFWSPFGSLRSPFGALRSPSEPS